MTDRAASSTAVGVAMLRAAHLILDGLPRVLDDTIILRLLGPDTEWSVRERTEQMLGPRATALRTHVLLRSRYAEERLHIAMERGVTQFLILGAGLDTFAYRQPEWAGALRIFEVDHPASQADKRQKLGGAGIDIPSNLVFVSVDFERETLHARLLSEGFDFGQPTFVSCLGVLVYLTMDAIRDLLRFIAALPRGSECVLTYGGHRHSKDSGTPSLADLAAAVGEPFRSPMDLPALNELCAEVGLEPPTLPTTSEIAEYLGDRQDWLRPPSRSSIASVMVADRQ